MKLLKYKVNNFRSVEDSGWIDTGNVTALIGVNESGKTNLLLPLWKLKPAQEGQIQPTSDYPKKKFAEIRAKPADFTFITCLFDTSDLAEEITQLTGAPIESVSTAVVSKNFDNKVFVSFPDHNPVRRFEKGPFLEILKNIAENFKALKEMKGEIGLADKVQEAIFELSKIVEKEPYLNADDFNKYAKKFKSVIPETPLKSSVVVSMLEQTVDRMKDHAKDLQKPSAGDSQEARDLVWHKVPKFVYYSNYGNLDSEIYLPHVVENLERTDLGSKETAKARTLRVLFDFVTLSPAEILELGQETDNPTDDQIEEVAEKKRERSILLQSAGTTLTKKFRNWWKQGDYRFRFEADGSHFRIWVSDDRRPEEIELENRSTGLQWFLSFYLIFLVESGGSHDSAILLLDEPGLSLSIH